MAGHLLQPYLCCPEVICKELQTLTEVKVLTNCGVCFTQHLHNNLCDGVKSIRNVSSLLIACGKNTCEVHTSTASSRASYQRGNGIDMYAEDPLLASRLGNQFLLNQVCCISHDLQENPAVVPRSSHDHILSNPLFINYPSI